MTRYINDFDKDLIWKRNNLNILKVLTVRKSHIRITCMTQITCSSGIYQQHTDWRERSKCKQMPHTSGSQLAAPGRFEGGLGGLTYLLFHTVSRRERKGPGMEPAPQRGTEKSLTVCQVQSHFNTLASMKGMPNASDVQG